MESSLSGTLATEPAHSMVTSRAGPGLVRIAAQPVGVFAAMWYRPVDAAAPGVEVMLDEVAGASCVVWSSMEAPLTGGASFFPFDSTITEPRLNARACCASAK